MQSLRPWICYYYDPLLPNPWYTFLLSPRVNIPDSHWLSWLQTSLWGQLSWLMHSVVSLTLREIMEHYHNTYREHFLPRHFDSILKRSFFSMTQNACTWNKSRIITFKSNKFSAAGRAPSNRLRTNKKTNQMTDQPTNQPCTHGNKTFKLVKQFRKIVSCKRSQLFTQSVIIFKFNTFPMTTVTLYLNCCMWTHHTDQSLNL